MKHPTEDSLLESVLELTSPEVETRIQMHLDSCAECRQRRQRLVEETAQLGSIDPQVATSLYPLPAQFRPRRLRPTSWLKVATLLAAGFLGGYAVSHLTQPESVRIVPYHREARTQGNPAVLLATCPAEDTAVDLSWLVP